MPAAAKRTESMFLAPWFAIAGLIAAAAPVVIHLLNRRRFRIIQWAAMDFLREAVLRSRRILQWRDLLLMALRTLCLLLFGLAMARPFFSGSEAAANPDQPVHAVLLVDNSLSMSYQKLDGTLLDDAKAKGREVIERLPRGSRISVLPICGSATAFSYDPYYTPEDALEALAAIQPVDRAATPRQTIDLALDACRRLPAMPAKQLVLLTDRQGASWPAQSLGEQGKQLPGPMQVVEVTAEDVENAWVADFKLRDGVADLQSPAVFVATIGYEGRSPRRDVQVTLTVDGVAIASQTIDLQPGQRREIRFPPYRFDVPVEPGKPTFVAAEVLALAGSAPGRRPTISGRARSDGAAGGVRRPVGPRGGAAIEPLWRDLLSSPVAGPGDQSCPARAAVDRRAAREDRRTEAGNARRRPAGDCRGRVRARLGRAAAARVRGTGGQPGDCRRRRVRPAIVDRGGLAGRRRNPARPARPHARGPFAR